MIVSKKSNWEKVKINSILQYIESRIEIVDDKKYTTIKVKRNHGGLEKREELFGNQIKTKKQFRIVPNSFIISRVQCWHKAFALVENVSTDMIASTNYDQFQIEPHIDKKFFWWLSHSPMFLKTIRDSAKGVDIEKMVFDREKWLNEELFLPEINEQRKIASKIGKSFSEINLAKQSLDHTKLQLEYQKQSLLKSAFEGKLTEKWRRQNEPVITDDESISKLLDEIKIKKDMTSSKKAKVGTIEKVNFSIPNSWAWVTVNDITEYVTDGEHITPKRSESGILLLSARNVQNGSISLDKVDFISESEYQRISKRLKIEIGDVLLSCSGTVGRCCILEKNLKFSLVRSVAVLRPFFEMGKFLSYAIRSPQVQTQINHKKKNTAQSNIFQNQIRALLIPLPPLLEQNKIVLQLEQGFSLISNSSETVNSTLQTLEILKTSILKQIFSGKLVN